ncbi:MAG: phosphonopyruvate decarboxylase [Alphaproteobacteria bacterium]|jgi:sulfopyruvate decarboxylase alpha subunit|nr:phosphonopyruvate decarboxylase [Alphaproteobacteria bacterium]
MTGAWQDALYDSLRDGGVTLFAYVPDAGHKVLIARAGVDRDAIAVPLASEQEGVGLLAGAHLGGGLGVLLMQSSGVGNCVNFFSLIRHGRFPFLALISMRGDFGEQNPWQLPMGQGAEPVMEAMGLRCMRVERAEDVVPDARAALAMATKSNAAVAMLLGQRLIGAKSF